MADYHNEIEPHAAQWIRNLMAAGRIPAGDVDERSIVDVHPDDLKGYTRCHFFAGIAGWALAMRWAGWPDDRQAWSGSCPCQPLSSAGLQQGHVDERHLWPSFYNLIAKCRPPAIFGEQVASKIGREWLSGVRADLEACGYAFGTAILPAVLCGAPHKRDRQWFVADAERNEQPRKEPRGGETGRVGRIIEPFPWDEPWESALSRFRALGDGVPRCVEGTDAARNAIVPQVAAEFITAFMGCRP
jgi:DNA (cytosine-5)-methyltransferase 1